MSKKIYTGPRQPVHQQGAERRVDPEGAQVAQQADQGQDWADWQAQRWSEEGQQEEDWVGEENRRADR